MKGKKHGMPKGMMSKGMGIKKATMSAAKKGGKSPFEASAEPGDLKPEGTMSKRRLDRPGRKHGGRAGADMAPLSSASKTTRC